MAINIRRATDGDLEPLTRIYNYYVVATTVTFDLEPKTVEQRAEWLSQLKDSGPTRHHSTTSNECE